MIGTMVRGSVGHVGIDQDKQRLRELMLNQAGGIHVFEGSGRAAQRLRSLKEYRRARTVMVMADEALCQARVNVLADGKTLLMASPGLRRGFIFLRPDQVAIRDRVRAVRGPQAHKHGPVVKPAEGPRVDFMVTGAVAVDRDGRRLGSGKGLFDLAFLILLARDRIKADVKIAALVDATQVVDGVPCDDGDVSIDLVVTPGETIIADGRPGRPAYIDWDRLSSKTVKRIPPLFELAKTIARS